MSAPEVILHETTTTTAYVEIAGTWPRETIQPGEEPFSLLELMIHAGHIRPYRAVAPVAVEPK